MYMYIYIFIYYIFRYIYIYYIIYPTSSIISRKFAFGLPNAFGLSWPTEAEALQHAAEAGHLAEALASLRSGRGGMAVEQPTPPQKKGGQTVGTNPIIL